MEADKSIICSVAGRLETQRRVAAGVQVQRLSCWRLRKDVGSSCLKAICCRMLSCSVEVFCSVQVFNLLDEAHPHYGGQSTQSINLNVNFIQKQLHWNFQNNLITYSSTVAHPRWHKINRLAHFTILTDILQLICMFILYVLSLLYSTSSRRFFVNYFLGRQWCVMCTWGQFNSFPLQYISLLFLILAFCSGCNF